MTSSPLDIVFFGLSITSSWGNGHATTFRALIRELAARGHNVAFFERDVPWYAASRDMPNPSFCSTHLYSSIEQVYDDYTDVIRKADFIIVGSYVPQGVELANSLFAEAQCPVGFYDIDTPVTLAKLETGDLQYLSPEAIQRYDLYLSFTGGPTLQMLEKKYGSPKAVPLYCSVDTDQYFVEQTHHQYELGYLGTYSGDRQGPLQELLIEPARTLSKKHFVVAGPKYPERIRWPQNVSRIEHLPPAEHRRFYNCQRFTLNITRAAMIRSGYSPSVRLFEAAACGTPIISDYWEGLNELFEPGNEILISSNRKDTILYLNEISEEQRCEIGEKARKRIIKEHTAAIRAEQLEKYLLDVLHPRSSQGKCDSNVIIARTQNG